MNVTAALITGFGLGLVYFGGLWGTVRILEKGGDPVWIPWSFAARLAALAVALFTLCEHGHSPAALILALVGVWLARGGILWGLARGGDSHGT